MYMKRYIASALAAALIVGAVATSFSSTAEAASRQDRVGAALAVGVIGLATGAIIASAAAEPRYVAQPPRRHIAPPPPPRHFRRPPPPPVYAPVHAGSRFHPWTPAWYRYCSNRYRSFNPNTGYFLSYSGEYRFCR